MFIYGAILYLRLTNVTHTVLTKHCEASTFWTQSRLLCCYFYMHIALDRDCEVGLQKLRFQCHLIDYSVWMITFNNHTFC